MSDGKLTSPSTTAMDSYSPCGAVQKVRHALGLLTIDRFRLIERTAYYLAERRGFQAGHELEDWLAAEREVDRMFGPPDAGGQS